MIANSRRGRVPGIVNASAAVAVLLLVAALAMRAAQAAPPAIAEFAPQAEQIKQSEAEQTSTFGSGAGGAGGAAPSPTPSAASALPADAVFLHCVGDPPRQIEDPQSPPCVPYWKGDNGGATSKGVTRERVRIFVPGGAVPSASYQEDIGNEQQVVPVFKRFFNQTFELYGRQLDLQLDVNAGGDASSTGQQAEAEKVDQQVGAFASTSYESTGGTAYYPALARHHIIGTAAEGEFSYAGDRLAQMKPYIWQYEMGADQQFANTADWVCSRLAGGDAVHAGDASMHGSKRVFGIIYDPSPNAATADYQSLQPLTSGLATCGASPGYVYSGPYVSLSGSSSSDTAMQNIIVDLRTHGVTSVICLCQSLPFVQFEHDAQGQGYYPEWLITTFGGIDEEIWYKDASYWAGAEAFPGTFGITFHPRQGSIANEPYYWALTEAGYRDSADQDPSIFWFRQWLYRSLLMLASGIQMAGPDLSPSTFAAGLGRTAFPNPDFYTMPGKVSFLGGSHTMTTDGAEWWWSDAAPSPFAGAGPGTFCYVDGGARHTYGNWPKGGDPFFQGRCDSG